MNNFYNSPFSSSAYYNAYYNTLMGNRFSITPQVFYPQREWKSSNNTPIQGNSNYTTQPNDMRELAYRNALPNSTTYNKGDRVKIGADGSVTNNGPSRFFSRHQFKLAKLAARGNSGSGFGNMLGNVLSGIGQMSQPYGQMSQGNSMYNQGQYRSPYDNSYYNEKNVAGPAGLVSRQLSQLSHSRDNEIGTDQKSILADLQRQLAEITRKIAAVQSSSATTTAVGPNGSTATTNATTTGQSGGYLGF